MFNRCDCCKFYIINSHYRSFIASNKLCMLYLSLQLAAIALNFGVLVSAVYEGIYARRGGDPTKIRVVTDPRGGTINNPGYREYHQPTNGKGGTDSRLISRNSTRSPSCVCVRACAYVCVCVCVRYVIHDVDIWRGSSAKRLMGLMTLLRLIPGSKYVHLTQIDTCILYPSLLFAFNVK